MEPVRDIDVRSVFCDATNSINTVVPADQVVVDPKERKRQRDKARYAALSEEQRSERRRKQQEAYYRPEAVEKRREARIQKQREKGMKENMDPTDQPAVTSVNVVIKESLRDMSEDWLHRNDACTPLITHTISEGVTKETHVHNEAIMDLTENTDAAAAVDHANQVLDPKERRRLRDKARYAALSEEQKSERIKKKQEKRREARIQKTKR